MRKQWVLVGILAGSLMAGPAFAQHKAPNQQPATDAAPARPTGELALGTVPPAEERRPRTASRCRPAPTRCG